ncbi:hypothetical protein ABK040_013161 [Willaertia magna]
MNQKTKEQYQPLFEQTLPIYVFKDSGQNGDAEAKLYMIKVTITGAANTISSISTAGNSSIGSSKFSLNSLTTNKKTTISPTTMNPISNVNSLIFTLTDESDLFFLYTSQIDETVYRNLKALQRLKTDFSQFASHLEQMFEMCSHSYQENKQDWCIKLSIQNKTKAILEIIYSDTFSENSKFHLELVEGSSDQKKEYLAEELKMWKQKAQELEKQLEHSEFELQNNITSSEKTIEGLRIENQELAMRLDKEVTSATYKLKEEITRTKEKHIEELHRNQSRHEDEKRMIEEKYHLQIKTLSQRIEEYMSQNKELLAAKFELESKSRELNTRLSQFENENKSYHEEVTKLREENRKLDTIKFEHEKKIRELETKVQLKEEIMKEKGMSLMTLNEVIKEKEQQEMSKAETITELKARYDALEREYHEKQAELKRCWDMIKRYAELRENFEKNLSEKKHKMKQLGASLMKRESEKRKLIQAIESQKQYINQKESEINSLKQSLDSKEAELTDAKKTIRTNEFFIESLKDKASSTFGTTRFDSLPTYSTKYNPNDYGSKTNTFISNETYTPSYLDSGDKTTSTVAIEKTSSPTLNASSYQNYYTDIKYNDKYSDTENSITVTAPKTNSFAFSIPSITPSPTSLNDCNDIQPSLRTTTSTNNTSRRGFVSFEPTLNKEWK